MWKVHVCNCRRRGALVEERKCLYFPTTSYLWHKFKRKCMPVFRQLISMEYLKQGCRSYINCLPYGIFWNPLLQWLQWSTFGLGKIESHDRFNNIPHEQWILYNCLILEAVTPLHVFQFFCLEKCQHIRYLHNWLIHTDIMPLRKTVTRDGGAGLLVAVLVYAIASTGIYQGGYQNVIHHYILTSCSALDNGYLA